MLTHPKLIFLSAKLPARPLLFLLAACYAAIILPVSVLSMLGYLPLDGLANPNAHAYELIFGMTSLVIAGYLLGQPKRWQLYFFLGLWLITRCTFFSLGFSNLTGILSGATTGWLAYLIAPAFWRAKKLTNKSVALILVLFSFLAWLTASQQALFSQLMTNNLTVLGSLLFFMGGRIIAPLLASFWLARKEHRPSRVQPAIELTVLICLGIAFVSNLLAPVHLSFVTNFSLLLAGVLTWVRILRWQPWDYWPNKDLVFLFCGYGFLATGLLLLGIKNWWLTANLLASHTLLLGSMTLLMLVVMARASQIKAFKQLKFAKSLNFIAVLMLLATFARLAAVLFPTAYVGLIHLATSLWIVAWLSLGLLLIKCQLKAAKTA